MIKEQQLGPVSCMVEVVSKHDDMCLSCGGRSDVDRVVLFSPGCRDVIEFDFAAGTSRHSCYVTLVMFKYISKAIPKLFNAMLLVETYGCTRLLDGDC